MLSIDGHNAVVAKLYAAALGETPWAGTLAYLADVFGASASMLQVSDAAYRQHRVENHGYSREFQEAFYASGVYDADPRIPFFRSVGPGSIYFDHLLFDVEEMYRHPACRESIDVLKVKYQLGALLRLPDGGVGALTLLQTEAEGHASAKAITAYRRLAPHMEQACALGQMLEFRAATQIILLDALAAKADGIVLLGCDGKPSFMNDAVRAMIASGDGLAFRDGWFAAARAPETRRLQSLVRDAIEASLGGQAKPGGQMLATRPSGRRPFVLRVMPAPRMERFLSGQSIACVIHIHDLATVPLPARASLAAVFGLREREIDLAVALVRCVDLSAAATQARMSINTARNHLQSIFRKCGVSSQAQAIQLFGRLP